MPVAKHKVYSDSDDPSVIAARERRDIKQIHRRHIDCNRGKRNTGLSEAIGSLILASMASKGRFTLDKQSGYSTSQRLQHRSFRPITGNNFSRWATETTASSTLVVKFNLLKRYIHCSVSKEICCQVCISEQYKQEVFKLLHEELRALPKT